MKKSQSLKSHDETYETNQKTFFLCESNEMNERNKYII